MAERRDTIEGFVLGACGALLGVARLALRAYKEENKLKVQPKANLEVWSSESGVNPDQLSLDD